MAKKTKDIKEKVSEPKVGKLVREPKQEETDKIAVFGSNGEYIRTYSEEVHGKNFKKLAEQFASKEKRKVKAVDDETFGGLEAQAETKKAEDQEKKRKMLKMA